MSRLAFLLFVSSAILVSHKTAYASVFESNGLTRNGANVCEDSRSRTEYTTRRKATRGYESYTTKCGWFGLSRCGRSRSVTRYREIRVTTSVWGVHLRCCSGWRRSGQHCTIPVCTRGCRHGSCVSPNGCRCNSGWTGSTCSNDVDDCRSNNGGCEQRCFNKPGPGRVCGCNRGYNPSGDRCIDINECATNGGTCKCAGSNYFYSCGGRCVNTQGSFRCTCGSGYRLVGGTTCVDINECSSNGGGCGHRCVNLIGSYRCSCLRGYRLSSNRYSCLDIDECQRSNGNCEQRCSNQAGSYRCYCKQGFRLDSNRRTCSDRNECLSYHGCDDTHGKCHNTYGSFYCTCAKGYALDINNNRTCVDVDECAPLKVSGLNSTARLADCQQTCINTDGSFRCSCQSGYRALDDEKQCEDIDECSLGSHKCSHSCHNTEGSYRCSCPLGYKLGYDGKTCQALPCESLLPPSQGRLNCSGTVTGSTCFFSCEPGYDMRGSTTRTCRPSSRQWTGDTAYCTAKRCSELRPSGVGTVLRMPCDREYGSVCDLFCKKGYYGIGIGKAKCALTADLSQVVWEVATFICKEFKGCRTNLCKNGGKCKTLGPKKFKCDCEGTGYTGTHCETGILYPPVYPRLGVGKKSRTVTIRARPSKGLKISVNYSPNLQFFPPPPYALSSLETKAAFAVKAANHKGVEIVSYKLTGPSQKYYSPLETSVIFVEEDVSLKNSIYTKLGLRHGTLPVGCHKVNVSMEPLSCPLTLSSTSPWKNINSAKSASSGISYVTLRDRKSIPLSLLGVDLSDLNDNDKKMRKILQKLFSVDLPQVDMIQKDTSCFSLKLQPTSISEFIQWDAFPTSFMKAVSAQLPDWFDFQVATNNDVFHIKNVAASLNKQVGKSGACAHLPVPSQNVAMYYTPLINYTTSIDTETVSMALSRDMCLAVDLCTSGVYWNMGETAGRMLKLTKIFENMKNAGWDLGITSIAVARSNTLPAPKLSGFVPLSHGYEVLKGFDHNIWMRGKLGLSVQSPNLLKVSAKFEGEAFVHVKQLNDLLTEQFSRPLTLTLEGDVDLNISSTVLNQDFTIHVSSVKTIGKAQFGGPVTNSQRCATPQGIFVTLRSVNNLFANTPLVNIVRPDNNQLSPLSIFHRITGGKQTGVANYRAVRRLLTNLRYGLRDLEDILEDIKPHVPDIPSTISGWSTLTEQFLKLVNKVRVSINGRKSVSVLVQIKRNIKEIRSKVKEFARIISTLTSILKSKPQSDEVTDLITSLNDVVDALPSSIELSLRASAVHQKLQSIQLKQTGRICIKQLCFRNLNITTEFKGSQECSKQRFSTASSVGQTSVVVSGTGTKRIPLGKLLTFSKQGKMLLWISRNDQHVLSHFQSRINLFGFSKDVKVELSPEKLTIQAEAPLYNRFLASMNISANVEGYKWDSLVFNVHGRMNKSSVLLVLLESQANNYTLQTVQTAMKRVENAEMALKNAKKRKDFFKNLIHKKKEAVKEIRLKQRKTRDEFHRARLRHDSAKQDFNATFIEFKKKTDLAICHLKDCSYVPLKGCIPKVCQKETKASYVDQTCTVQTKKVEVEKIVETSVTETYKEATFKDSCCASCSLFYITGCDQSCKRVPGPPKVIQVQKIRNTLTKVPIDVKEFTCSRESKTIVSGFGTAYKCCNENVKDNVEIMDPKCVLHNVACLDNMAIYTKILEAENKTLFDSYTRMMEESEKIKTLQMDLDKLRIQHKRSDTERKLVEARFRQQEFSVNVIDIAKVKNRERRALNLGLKMKRSPLKKPISIEAIEFDTVVSSNKKTSFPITISLHTIDGQKRLQNVLMDFKSMDFSLKYTAKQIAKLLVGDKEGLERKKRSLKQGNTTTLENEDREIKKMADYASSCIFSRNTKLFFADIINSMSFAVGMTVKFDNNILKGNQDIERSVQMITSQYNSQESRNRSMVRAFHDMVDAFRKSQEDPSQFWNQTLFSWRGLADTLPQVRGMSDCSGASDCIDVVSDELLGLYDLIDDPKSMEMQRTLTTMRDSVHNLVTQNYSVWEARETLDRLKILLSKSKDNAVLCGRIPRWVSNTPNIISVLEGEESRLLCKAESATNVQYTWYKDDKVIQESKQGKLLFQNTTSTDSGAYKCKASNHIGSISSNFTLLVVESKPLIFQQPIGNTIIQGIPRPLYIICNATGKPTPKLRWFFTPMNSSVTMILANETHSVLYKEKPDIADSGFYYCDASNKHGTVRSITARVDVLNASIGEPRMLLSMNITITKSNSSKLTVIQKGNLDLNRDQFLRVLSQAMQTNASSVAKLNFTSNSNERVNVVAVVNNKEISGKDLPVNSADSISVYARERIKLGKSLEALRTKIIEGSFVVPVNGTLLIADPQSLAARLLIQKCPPGQYPHRNGYLCVNCAAGTHGTEGGGCQECALGTYQPHQGQAACVSCGRRFTTSHNGTVYATECVAPELKCDAPRIPSHAYLRFPQENFTKGDIIKWACRPGYEAIGKTEQTCLGPGWSNEPVQCNVSCPVGWEKFNKSCYLAVANLTARMSDARAGCHRLEAELVDILTPEENSFVHQYSMKNAGQLFIWLGLQRDERRKFTKWLTGKSLKGFTNWFVGEPNDYGGTEGCATMNVGPHRSGWNDVSCHFIHKPSFVCKKPKP